MTRCPLCHSARFVPLGGQAYRCDACGNDWTRSREIEIETSADYTADRLAAERRARRASRSVAHVTRVIRGLHGRTESFVGRRTK